MAVAASYVAAIGVDLTEMERGIVSARQKLAQMGEGVPTTGVDSFVNRASASFASLRSGIADVSSSLRDFGGSMTLITAPLVGIAGLAAKIGVSFDSMKQQATIAFTTMLGGADKARVMLENLTSFAAKTPFTLRGLIPLTQQLLAFGFAAEDIIPTLTGVGDAIAGLGRGEPEMQRFILNLGQIKAIGHVTGRELRDMSTLGINAIQILADTMGKSVPQMQEMVSKGLVPADFAIKALVEGLEKGTKNTVAFGGMMEKQSHTIAGIMSNLKDTADKTLGDIFQPLVDKATPALERFQQKLQEFGNQVKDLGLLKALSELTGFSEGFIKAAAAIAGVLVVAGPVTYAIGLLGAAIAALTGPVGIAVAAIAGFAALYATNMGGIADKTNEIIQSLNNIWQGHGSALTQIMGTAFREVVAILETAAALLLGIISSVLHLMQGEWQAAWHDLADIVQTSIDAQAFAVYGGGVQAGKNYAVGLASGTGANIGPWAEGVMTEVQHLQIRFAQEGAAAGAAYARAMAGPLKDTLKNLMNAAKVNEAAVGGNPLGLPPGVVRIDDSVIKSWQAMAKAAEGAGFAVEGSGKKAAVAGTHLAGVGKGAGVAKAAFDEFKAGAEGVDKALTKILSASPADLDRLFESLGKKARGSIGELTAAFKAVAPVVNEFLTAQGVAAKTTDDELAKMAKAGDVSLVAYAGSWRKAQEAVRQASIEMATTLPVSLKDLNVALKESGFDIEVNGKLWSELDRQQKINLITIGNAVKANQDLDRSVTSTSQAIEGATEVILTHDAKIRDAFDAYRLGTITFGELAQVLKGKTAESLEIVAIKTEGLGEKMDSLAHIIKEKLSAALQSLNLEWAQMQNDAGRAVEGVVKEFEELAARLGLTGDKAVAFVLSSVRPLVDKLPAEFKTIGERTLQQWKNDLNKLPGALDEIFNKLLSGAKRQVSGLFDIIGAIPGKFGDVLRKTTGTITDWVNRIDIILKGLHKIFQSIPDGLSDLFASLFGKLKQTGSELSGVLSGTVSEAGASASKTAKAVGVNMGNSLISGITSAIQGTAIIAAGVGGIIASRAQGGLTGALGGAISGAMLGLKIGSFFGVGGLIGAGIGALIGGLIGAFGGSKSPLQKAQEAAQLQQAKDAIKLSMQAVLKGAQEVIQSAITSFNLALDFFNKLDQFTAVRREQFRKFFKAFSLLMDYFVELAKKWSGESLAKAKALAEAIGPVVQIIAAAPAALDGIGRYLGIAQSSIETFFVDLKLVFDRFAVLADETTNHMEKQVKKFSQRFLPAVEVINGVIAALVSMASLKPVEDSAFDVLKVSLEKFVSKIGELAEFFEKKLLKTIEFFAEKAGPAVELWKNSVDAISSMAEIKAPSEGAFNTLFAGIEAAINGMVDLATRLSTEGLSRAQAVATASLAIFSAIKAGVEALTQLQTYKDVASEVFGAFVADFDAAITMLEQMNQRAIQFEFISKSFEGYIASGAASLAHAFEMLKQIMTAAGGFFPGGSPQGTSGGLSATFAQPFSGQSFALAGGGSFAAAGGGGSATTNYNVSVTIHGPVFGNANTVEDAVVRAITTAQRRGRLR